MVLEPSSFILLLFSLRYQPTTFLSFYLSDTHTAPAMSSPKPVDARVATLAEMQKLERRFDAKIGFVISQLQEVADSSVELTQALLDIQQRQVEVEKKLRRKEPKSGRNKRKRVSKSDQPVER